MAEPNATRFHIGMWNPTVLMDARKIKTFNRQPIDVTKDQTKYLYTLLYPFIASEFVHRTDMFNYITKLMEQFQAEIRSLNQQLSSLHSQVTSHTHIGNLGSPTSPSNINPAQPGFPGYTKPELKLWKTKPEDNEFKFGESLILAARQSIPALQKRNPNKAADKVVNTKDAHKITSQLAKGDYLAPFDIEEDSIDQPSKFSR